MNVQPVLKNTYLAEVNIKTPTVSQRYPFENIPNLAKKGVRLKGIAAYSGSQLATTPSGNTVIAAAAVPNFVVVLTEDQNEKVYAIPLYELIANNNGGIIRLLDMYVNLTKCYLICNNITGVNAGESVAFTFIYE